MASGVVKLWDLLLQSKHGKGSWRKAFFFLYITSLVLSPPNKLETL